MCIRDRKNTKIVWIETPTNPTLKLIDVQAACKLIKEANPDIKIVVDNTFASPFISSPLLLGADVAYHSLTKFMAGHSDIVMGGLIFKEEAYKEKVFFAAVSMGANPGIFDCYLALRGIKTLELRVYQGTKSAYHIAHFLEKHPLIDSIIYPGLKSNKHH